MTEESRTLRQVYNEAFNSHYGVECHEKAQNLALLAVVNYAKLAGLPNAVPPDTIDLIASLNNSIKRISEPLYVLQDPQREVLTERISELSKEILILSQSRRIMDAFSVEPSQSTES